jgi:uncharacterized protein YabE (DUF348 family)
MNKQAQDYFDFAFSEESEEVKKAAKDVLKILSGKGFSLDSVDKILVSLRNVVKKNVSV